jgi:hypothetical protein
MTKEELYAHPGWEWCTFEGARKHVLLMGLQSTFREKLEWLEEAETLTLRCGKDAGKTNRQNQPAAENQEVSHPCHPRKDP